MRKQRLRPRLDIRCGLGSEGDYLGSVFECLQGVVQEHCQEEKEFEGQDPIVAPTKLKSACRTAKDQIKKSGDQ